MKGKTMSGMPGSKKIGKNWSNILSPDFKESEDTNLWKKLSGVFIGHLTNTGMNNPISYPYNPFDLLCDF